MYYIITASWIVTLIVSWNDGNRAMPIVIGLLGAIIQAGIWYLGFGYFGVGGLGLLTVICMWSVPDIFIRGGV